METPTQNVPAAEDSGLRCWSCDYNLTGIDSSRCPECGQELNWEALHFATKYGPQHPLWERAAWRWMPLAFVVTCLEVVFMPWQFAKRIGHRPRLIAPFGFLLTCLAIGVSLIEYHVGIGNAIFVTLMWPIGLTFQIGLQTYLFAFFLRPPQVAPKRFWFSVTAYTSYPLMLVGGWPEQFVIIRQSSLSLFPIDLLNPFAAGQSHSPYLPMKIVYYWWLIGLIIIAMTRLDVRHRWRSLLLIVLIPLMTYGSNHTGVYGCFSLFTILKWIRTYL